MSTTPDPQPDPTPDPAPDPTPDPAPDPTPDPDDDLAGLTPEARQIVERANAQAARYRRDARAAEKALADERKKAETDRERELREAEERGFAKAAPAILEATLSVAAAGRLQQPSDAYRLLDEGEREELLKLDEDGRRKRADELVGELLEARPYLAIDDGNGSSSSGSPRLVTPGARTPDRPGRVPQDPDAWLRGLGRDRRR